MIISHDSYLLELYKKRILPNIDFDEINIYCNLKTHKFTKQQFLEIEYSLSLLDNKITFYELSAIIPNMFCVYVLLEFLQIHEINCNWEILKNGNKIGSSNIYQHFLDVSWKDFSPDCRLQTSADEDEIVINQILSSAASGNGAGSYTKRKANNSKLFIEKNTAINKKSFFSYVGHKRSIFDYTKITFLDYYHNMEEYKPCFIHTFDMHLSYSISEYIKYNNCMLLVEN